MLAKLVGRKFVIHKALKILLIVVLLGLLAGIGFNTLMGPGDACLDSGGCWDSVGKVCRKEEPNAQALCDRTK